MAVIRVVKQALKKIGKKKQKNGVPKIALPKKVAILKK